MRLSIEVTPEQHQRLKASAALQGQSVKDHVLKRTLPDTDEEAALKELEAFLKPRLEAARRGERASRTVSEIFDEVLQEENKKVMA